MKYQELMKEVEGVGKLKLSEQENFYRDVLNESLIRQKRLLTRSFCSIKVCHL